MTAALTSLQTEVLRWHTTADGKPMPPDLARRARRTHVNARLMELGLLHGELNRETVRVAWTATPIGHAHIAALDAADLPPEHQTRTSETPPADWRERAGAAGYGWAGLDNRRRSRGYGHPPATARCTCGWSRLCDDREQARADARAHRADPEGGPASMDVPLPTVELTGTGAP